MHIQGVSIKLINWFVFFIKQLFWIYKDNFPEKIYSLSKKKKNEERKKLCELMCIRLSTWKHIDSLKNEISFWSFLEKFLILGNL